jgi:hypothetical protein
LGERFTTRAQVLKPGKQQVFTRGELFAIAASGEEELVAIGETLPTALPDAGQQLPSQPRRRLQRQQLACFRRGSDACPLVQVQPSQPRRRHTSSVSALWFKV